MLTVDPGRDRLELVRFWAKVVKGPQARDCWLWRGAIADDGYGRFWIKRDGRVLVVRPHRYAYAAAFGLLDDGVVVMHDCDEPICCRADPVAVNHLIAGTQADNLAMMGDRGRSWGGAWIIGRHLGTNRAAMVARSRALRDAIRNGWDADALAAAAITAAPRGQPSLF